ncbi:hypothetical protein [Metabacillus litoralis]|uniref:hypothetical protein n=1 Tax=Metabacillus litoralis TaxID=152268 RepID=UPI001CFC640A|nr:hypothetical protein [Metabacillus litoralis]
MKKWFYLLSFIFLSTIVISVIYLYFHYKSEVENNHKYIEVSQEFGEIEVENDKVNVAYRVRNITDEELNLRFDDNERQIDVAIESEVSVKNVTTSTSHRDNIFSPHETWEYKIEIETNGQIKGENFIEVRFIPYGVKTLSSISTVWGE